MVAIGFANCLWVRPKKRISRNRITADGSVAYQADLLSFLFPATPNRKTRIRHWPEKYKSIAKGLTEKRIDQDNADHTRR